MIASEIQYWLSEFSRATGSVGDDEEVEYWLNEFADAEEEG